MILWHPACSLEAPVTEEVKRRRTARTLTTKGARAAIVHAKSSTCGDPIVTRCCVYRFPVLGSPVTCMLKEPADCHYGVLRKWAEDLGPGSCLPNPCPP
jgi:hypothetical protein